MERPLQCPGTEDYLARKLYSASQSRGSYHFIVQDGAKKTYLYVRNISPLVLGGGGGGGGVYLYVMHATCKWCNFDP